MKKKFWFRNVTANAMSAMILSVAMVTALSRCQMFFYQPKAPENLKERLMAKRGKDLQAGLVAD